MTPTWAQLHAMEPGLRPDPSWVGQTNQAARWLSQFGTVSIDRPAIRGPRGMEAGPKVYFQVIDQEGVTIAESERGGSRSLDEALRAACAAVIGGRKS